MTADITLDITYFLMDKPVDDITVLVWNIVHNPPKAVNDVMTEGIMMIILCGIESQEDMKAPKPLVISSKAPSSDEDRGERLRVYNSKWLIIVNNIMYPPIFTCISNAERIQLSIIWSRLVFFEGNVLVAVLVNVLFDFKWQIK